MKKRGCFSYLLVIVISVIATLLITGVLDISELTDGFDSGDGSVIEFGDITEPSEENPPLGNRTDRNFTLYYDQLNDVEKRMYEAFEDGIPEGRFEYEFKGIDEDRYMNLIFRALCAFTYDYPEYFWVQSGISVSSSRPLFETVLDANVEVLQFEYWQYTMNKEKKIKELEQAVEAVAGLAREIPSTYEQIRFVHDYLAENAIYDFDALEESKKSSFDPSVMYIYSAYGCLVNGKTVCAGFAKAFQLIMRELGYDCLYVVGDAGGPHAWNCVYVEDKGYYIDITWDNTDYEYDEPTYEYFLIDEEALIRTHLPDEDFDVPACDDDQFSYYSHYGFLVEEYDFDEVSRVVEAQEDRHVISVQFGSLAELADAYEALVTNTKLFKIPALKEKEVFSIQVNEDHYTLIIYLK